MDCLFHKIISVENLFLAWQEFRRGKNKNIDIKAFSFNLEDHLFALNSELLAGTWNPDVYTGFYIKDPKPRHIHKATVRDRVLHQAVFRILDPLFEPYFIAHSYSSQVGKGTHAGVRALESFGRKATRNWKRKAYVLSLDIRKFFDSIDHSRLGELIARRIPDIRVRTLTTSIIRSFQASPQKGLPLGNVTSQLFANVYLNELDQFMGRTIRARYYARYCDDFLIVSEDKEYLESLVPRISEFLSTALGLLLHPQKIEIRSFRQRIDFLGYVVRPHHRLFRTRTKQRLFKKMRNAIRDVKSGDIEESTLLAMAQSYRGMLSHSRSRKIKRDLEDILESYSSQVSAT
ncbi:RNA-directed DNA polymerase [soil metagenome]